MQTMMNVSIPGCPEGCTLQNFKDVLYNEEKAKATIIFDRTSVRIFGRKEYHKGIADKI